MYGFTRRYAVSRLVYVEFQETMIEAITREKQIKKMAQGLETGIDREHEPAMDRSLRQSPGVMPWTPAFAGVTHGVVLRRIRSAPA
jgi:hypothetical protein